MARGAPGLHPTPGGDARPVLPRAMAAPPRGRGPPLLRTPRALARAGKVDASVDARPVRGGRRRPLADVSRAHERHDWHAARPLVEPHDSSLVVRALRSAVPALAWRLPSRSMGDPRRTARRAAAAPQTA